MLFLRLGPRFLFVRTEDINAVKQFLVTQLDGKPTVFPQGKDEASENSTLFFLTDKDKVATHVEDAKEIVLVNESAAICLSTIINSHVDNIVHRVDMGPASLIMRIAGDQQKIIQRLQNEYNGQLVDWEEGITKGEKGDTLISLTSKPLNKALTGDDMISPNILIPHPIPLVHKRLRVEGVRFITENMENYQWYELRINIYDSKGRYEEHHDRLMFVLDKLEIGMVLGESWTKDHALSLMSVLAYQVRLFTFYTPQEIKQLLVGLEYDIEGERLVDYDLYYRNKKLSWTDMEKRKGKPNKIELSRLCRRELYDRLSKEDIVILEGLEEGLK